MNEPAADTFGINQIGQIAVAVSDIERVIQFQPGQESPGDDERGKAVRVIAERVAERAQQQTRTRLPLALEVSHVG